MSVRPALVALWVLAGVTLAMLVVAQVEWPGTLADCVEAGTCDCETVGKDGIRQPVNALSSLGLVVVGAVALTRSATAPLRLLAGALIAAGTASFMSHAAVRDWAHTLDSLGVKALVLVLLVYPLTRPRPIWPPYLAALIPVWMLELLWPATARPLLVALVVGAVLVNLPREIPRPELLWGGIVLLLALVAWWLGRSASPFCDPDSLLQPHALWHLMVAGGLAAIHQHYRAADRR